MANSDKNILITPNTGSSTLSPTIVFRGANNTPVTLRTLDTGTISFEGTAGQLFSISDGLSGSIFSVNDISGIPSIEVLDTGLIKLNQYSGSTAFGSSAAIQNSSSVNAKVSISTVFPATPGLIIKSAASQTANLQEWQNSTGTVLALITPLGGITVSSDITQYGSGRTFIGGAADAGAFLNVGIPTASRQGIVVRANASQTANLQEWQNSSGTVLSKVESTGAANFIRMGLGGATPATSALFVTAPSAAAIAVLVRGAASQTADLQQWGQSDATVVASVNFGGGIRGNSFRSITATSIPATFAGIPFEAAGIGAIIRGNASQTGDLQQWQNSAGSVLSYVDSAGKIFANGLRLNGSDGSNNNVYKTGTLGLLSGLGIQLYLNQDNNATGGSLVIRAMNAQTSNLTEWKNVAGTVLSLVDAYGRLGISTSILANSTGGYSQVSIANVNTTDTNLIIKGYASQTANLQEWQNSSGSVLLSVSSDGSLNKTGTLNIGPILSFANPGVGNETKFVFNKTNDSAYLTVKERSSDQTFYEFGMWDNALDGGDYFQWSMGQWSGGTGQGWMPIQLGYNTSPNGSKTQTLRFTGEQSVFWSPILTGTNTPYYTTTVNHSSNVDYEIFKYYPDTSATRTIPRTNASGGATLNIDLSGYTYSSRMGYKITVNSGGTTFDYSTYGGDNSSGTAIAITVGSWQTLSNGTKIKINGTPAASDDWQFLAFPTPRVSFGGSAEATALVTIKPSASDKGLVVKGAASQTANLQEWQNSSGAVMASISASGSISQGSSTNYTLLDSAYGQVSIRAGGNLSGSLTVGTGAASITAIIVKGAASQTANLQEWQNSSGTLLSAIDKAGNLTKGDGDQLVLASQIFG